MAKGYLILNAFNMVIATHKWGGEMDRPCPIVPETGGVVITVSETGVDEIVALMVGGQSLSVIGDGELRVAGEKIGSIIDGEVVMD